MPTKKEMQATIDMLSAEVTWLTEQHSKRLAKDKARDAEMERIKATLERHGKRIHKLSTKDDAA